MPNTRNALTVSAKAIIDAAKKNPKKHNLPLDLPSNVSDELLKEATSSGFIVRLNLNPEEGSLH